MCLKYTMCHYIVSIHSEYKSYYKRAYFLSLTKIQQGKPTIKGHGSLKKEHFLTCIWKQALANSTSNENSNILFRNSIFTATSFRVVWSRNIQISVRFIQATVCTTNFIEIIPIRNRRYSAMKYVGWSWVVRCCVQ